MQPTHLLACTADKIRSILTFRSKSRDDRAFLVTCMRQRLSLLMACLHRLLNICQQQSLVCSFHVSITQTCSAVLIIGARSPQCRMVCTISAAAGSRYAKSVFIHSARHSRSNACICAFSSIPKRTCAWLLPCSSGCYCHLTTFMHPSLHSFIHLSLHACIQSVLSVLPCHDAGGWQLTASNPA